MLVQSSHTVNRERSRGDRPAAPVSRPTALRASQKGPYVVLDAFSTCLIIIILLLILPLGLRSVLCQLGGHDTVHEGLGEPGVGC